MNWIIVAVLIIMAFFFLRLKHLKHKIWLILFIIAILFFYSTGSQVLEGNEINWRSLGGIEKALKIYFSWLGGAFDNLKTITAGAIKMDWSKNKTKETVQVIGEE